jgi:hypothetical protein
VVTLAINKDTQVQRNVILSKELDKKLNDDANNNHRSISGQIAYILDQYYKDK